MVAEDHVPTAVKILLARLSALVVLGTAWVVMDAVAVVSLAARRSMNGQHLITFLN